MQTISDALSFFIQLSKLEATVTRRFDSGLGGLSFNEFIILWHLKQAGKETVRPTDLAARLGLTASGVTRLLLPMEKTGLLKRKRDENDARASHIIIAPGGKMKLEEAMERAEYLADELIPKGKDRKVAELAALLSAIGR